MSVERSHRLAIAFARETAKSATARLCAACVEVLDVSGAGITIMGGEHAGPMCVSDQRVGALEELQYTIGVGPCRDAFRSGVAVHAPSLGREVWARWPSFVDLAHESDIGAVFAYPLAAGGATVGVLSLYQRNEGELTVGQHDDTMGMAEVLAETVLSLQDEVPDGSLAAGVEDTMRYRAQIYQASGMVSVQLSIPVTDALLRMRAHAFTNGMSVAEVADRIVQRQLRLSNDVSNQSEG